MTPTHGKHSWSHWRRRLCSAVTLLAYLTSAIGFPIPVMVASPGSTCGQQVCCCGTAEQCRASGCACPHHPAPTPAPDVDPVPSCCAKKKSQAKASCCVKETTAKSPTPAPSKVKP